MPPFNHEVEYSRPIERERFGTAVTEIDQRMRALTRNRTSSTTYSHEGNEYHAIITGARMDIGTSASGLDVFSFDKTPARRNLNNVLPTIYFTERGDIMIDGLEWPGGYDYEEIIESTLETLALFPEIEPTE